MISCEFLVVPNSVELLTVKVGYAYRYLLRLSHRFSLKRNFKHVTSATADALTVVNRLNLACVLVF